MYLAINDAKLKQVKNCETARDICQKLELIFELKGLAKKASLWKWLITHRLKVSGNVRVHIDEFFDIIDKFSKLNVEIGDKLQSIILLPESFDNFRCAIESRDSLSDSEALKIKILDEDITRTERTRSNDHDTALFAQKTKDSKKEKAGQDRDQIDRWNIQVQVP